MNRLILAGVAVTFAVSACGDATTDRRSVDPGQGGVHTERLRGEPVAIDGQRYSSSDDGAAVSVPVGGGCQTTGTATVAVEEGPDRVTLTAHVARPPSTPEASQQRPDEVCTADLILQRVDVELREPVGSREVYDGVTAQPLTAAR